MNFSGTEVTQQGSYQFAVIDTQDPRRSAVERFIASRFSAAHDAQIASFMPQLLVVFDSYGAIKAAVGVRGASQDRLFLEHYFDQPIENIIDARVEHRQREVIRKQVVEVGNLASVDRFASRRLFEMLALFLIEHHFQWIVFTGCSSLRRVFKRMQLELVALGKAEESRIPSAFGSWGCYYRDNPQVLLGHLSGGLALAEAASAMTGRRA